MNPQGIFQSYSSVHCNQKKEILSPRKGRQLCLLHSNFLSYHLCLTLYMYDSLYLGTTVWPKQPKSQSMLSYKCMLFKEYVYKDYYVIAFVISTFSCQWYILLDTRVNTIKQSNTVKLFMAQCSFSWKWLTSFINDSQMNFIIRTSRHLVFHLISLCPLKSFTS